MKVSAYTNSCTVSVNAKITTVRMAGTERGRTVFANAPTTVQPSTIAPSSISRGTDLKKPISSQVQNGMGKVGEATTRAHMVSCNPSNVTRRARAGDRSDGARDRDGK